MKKSCRAPSPPTDPCAKTKPLKEQIEEAMRQISGWPSPAQLADAKRAGKKGGRSKY